MSGLRTLMVACSLVLFAHASLAATEVPDLPIDVQRYLDRRASCDHWRGEDGYDPERAREIRIGICKSCGGSDVGLEFLKKQHADDPVVMEQLAALDPSIEDKDMGGHGKMCNDVWTGGGPPAPAPAAAPSSSTAKKAAAKKSAATGKQKIVAKTKASGKTSTKPPSKVSSKPSGKPAQKAAAKPKGKTKSPA